MAVFATELLGGPALDADQPSSVVDQRVARAQPLLAAPAFVDGERQRRTAGPLKRGIHELRDPSGWPAEPPAPSGPLDAARFDDAVVSLCGEVAPDAGLPEVARLV